MSDWIVGDASGYPPGAPAGLRVPSLDDITAGAGDRVVLIRDGWVSARDLPEQRRVLAWGATLLPVRQIEDLAIIGPWVSAERPGCQLCAERRRRLWRRQTMPQEDLDGDRPAALAAPPRRSAVAAIVAALLSGELTFMPGELYVMRPDLTGRIHRVEPVPTCPECGRLPDDSPDRVRIDLMPVRPARPEVLRRSADLPDRSALRRRMVDWRFGPVGHVYRTESSPLALVSAEVALLSGDPGEGGHGRSLTYASSESIALLEAAERLVSATPHARRTVVHAAEQDLPEAVPLRTLGLHCPEFYDHRLFRFQPYDPAVATDWVWGWQMAAGRAVLLPEHVAYWNVDGWARPRLGPRFLYESSNGCASGSCLEEAVLYGLLEVAERDAFLLAWYGQRPLRPLAISDDEHRWIALMRATLDPLGYDLHLFDATTDIGVPCVLSLVVHREDVAPKAFFAAGAHPDPYRAAETAGAEATTNAVLRARYDVARRRAEEERARRLLDDLTEVHSLRDHTVLYTLPETAGWWRHLDPTREAVTVSQAFGDWRARWLRPDLAGTAWEIIKAFTNVGLDPIVVNLTPPEPYATGQYTVKVVVPGTVPMTFGHVHQRLIGLPRLASSPIPAPYPHPFP
jgi:ribosomal protein S12 methylthiotransferase accessory factor